MSQEVIYRKYRSQRFAEVVGQDAVVKTLQQAVKENRVGHAYLFTGPRGTGKTSLARILAKALNCSQQKDGEPCDSCNSCRAIRENRFLDLVEIDAASNRGIDEIRELKEKVNFLPVEGKVKVYIIDEVHMLTNEAFNALLKTLEEPPANVVFILATTEPHKIPATIISRSQRFDFKLAGPAELRQKLELILKGENIKIDSEALELVVRAGNGSFRDAESVLQKVISSVATNENSLIGKSDIVDLLGYADFQVVDDMIAAIASGDQERLLVVTEELHNEGKNLLQVCKQILEQSRELLSESLSDNKNETKEYSLSFILQLINQTGQLSEELKYSLLPIATFQAKFLALADNFGEENQSSDGSIRTGSKVVAASQKGKILENDNTQVKREAFKQTKSREKPKNKPGNLSLGYIQAQWQNVIIKAKENNPHLAAFLIKAAPEEVSENQIKLVVPFKYHKQKLESAKIVKIFSEITENIFGISFSPNCRVDEGMKNNSAGEERKNSNSDLVEEVFADIM